MRNGLITTLHAFGVELATVRWLGTGVIGGEFDELRGRSTLWYWPSPQAPPQRLATGLRGRISGLRSAPDDKKLSFVLSKARSSLWVLDLARGRPKLLCRGQADDLIRFGRARFSPDSRRIAFGLGRNLQVCDLAGKLLHAHPSPGLLDRWLDEGLLCRAPSPRRHLVWLDDRSGRMRPAVAPWEPSPDGRYRVRAGFTTLSFLGPRGKKQSLSSKGSNGMIGKGAWPHPHWFVLPTGWALDPATLEKRWVGSAPLPSPAGDGVLIRDGRSQLWGQTTAS